MSQENLEQKESAAAVVTETKPVIETQAEIAKEVKTQVRKNNAKIATAKTAKAKTGGKSVKKTAGIAADKIIKSESNPPRPDKKHVEKGDLLVPVE